MDSVLKIFQTALDDSIGPFYSTIFALEDTATESQVEGTPGCLSIRVQRSLYHTY